MDETDPGAQLTEIMADKPRKKHIGSISHKIITGKNKDKNP